MRVIALLLLASGFAATMRTYDCDHKDTKFDAIDLIEPRPCPIPTKDYREPKNILVQVVQTETSLPVVAYQCQITVSKKVTRCGFNSITYGSVWAVWSQPKILTPTECLVAATNTRVTVEGQEFNAYLGMKTQFTYFSHGTVDITGNCQTANFVTNGILYENSYEETFIVVYLKKLYGIADLSSGLVKFNNGLRARYQEAVLRDTEEGTVVWSVEIRNCTDTVSEVYNGNATLHRYIPDKGSLLESIVMISNDETRQYAGLVLRNEVRSCSARCYGTQIKGIIVCLYREREVKPLPSLVFQPQDDPNQSNLQTQLAFLHLSGQMNTLSKFIEIQGQICKLDRSVLFNKLQIIADSNNQYSLLDLYGPGHSTFVAGAVAYVAKCVPQEATRRPFENCTKEIPVMVGDQERFADPLTKILKVYPTVLPCSKIMPVRWHIDGDWWCADPTPYKCQSPNQLNLSMDHLAAQFDFTRGLEGGLYTAEQLEAHRLFQINYYSREAVLNKVTLAAVQSTQGTRLGMVVSLEDVRDLAKEVSWHILPFFYWFGDGWNYFTGFCMVIVICKVILGNILRAALLYRQRGCGWWMLAAIWHTAFTIVTTPLVIIKKTTEALMTPNEAMPEQQPLDPNRESMPTHTQLRRRVQYYLSCLDSDIQALRSFEESDTTIDLTGRLGQRRPDSIVKMNTLLDKDQKLGLSSHVTNLE